MRARGKPRQACGLYNDEVRQGYHCRSEDQRRRGQPGITRLQPAGKLRPNSPSRLKLAGFSTIPHAYLTEIPGPRIKSFTRWLARRANSHARSASRGSSQADPKTDRRRNGRGNACFLRSSRGFSRETPAAALAFTAGPGGFGALAPCIPPRFRTGPSSEMKFGN